MNTDQINITELCVMCGAPVSCFSVACDDCLKFAMESVRVPVEPVEPVRPYFTQVET